MKDLNIYLAAANQSTEKWFSKNHPLICNEVIEYCKNMDMSFKQKLWHYQNKVNVPVICSSNNCNNLVKFKGSWRAGYYNFCSQKCSVSEVEHKKSLLNYSRIAKYSKEEKQAIELKRTEEKILRDKKSQIKKDKTTQR